jgi:predicted phosphohydrolase
MVARIHWVPLPLRASLFSRAIVFNSLVYQDGRCVDGTDVSWGYCQFVTPEVGEKEVEVSLTRATPGQAKTLRRSHDIFAGTSAHIFMALSSMEHQCRMTEFGTNILCETRLWFSPDISIYDPSVSLGRPSMG